MFPSLVAFFIYHAIEADVATFYNVTIEANL
jgi:hypothetical protein